MSRFLTFPLLLTLTACLLKTVSCQRDDTVRERAIGKDVVDAVLSKIDRAQIFPADHSFLIRLAYVESHFGADADTFRANYFGGIWQVDEQFFNQTKQNSTQDNYHQQIQDKFNINWGAVTWRNLLTPMHSGLAAALYFARSGEPIPQTIATQAAYWKKHYRYEDNVAEFIKGAQELRDETGCRGKLDLCIVLDSSGSISSPNYLIAKNFTAEVIESLTLDFTRIGMLVYSSNVLDIFELRNNLTIPQMATRARNAAHLAGGTSTDLGILRAIKYFNETEVIEGVPKVMMVLTDGQSNGGDLNAAVRAIRNNSVKSMSVGIGSRIVRDELLLIALNDSRSVFELADFASLQDFLDELTDVTCKVPQKPEVNGTYKDALERNEKRVYQIGLPAEGLSITIDVTAGSTKGYWSLTEEVPSSALHDGTLGAWTYIPAPKASVSQANPTVYFTIEGTSNMNNYTVSAKEGRVDEPKIPETTTNAGSTTVGLTCALTLVIMSIRLF